MALTLTWFNLMEHLWDIMFQSIRCCQVAPQTLQELRDALTQTWEDIPQDAIHHLIRSMLHAYKHVGATQDIENHFELQKLHFGN